MEGASDLDLVLTQHGFGVELAEEIRSLFNLAQKYADGPAKALQDSRLAKNRARLEGRQVVSRTERHHKDSTSVNVRAEPLSKPMQHLRKLMDIGSRGPQRDHARDFVFEGLADVWQRATGREPLANYNDDRGDRRTDFMLFVEAVLRSTGREDWLEMKAWDRALEAQLKRRKRWKAASSAD